MPIIFSKLKRRNKHICIYVQGLFPALQPVPLLCGHVDGLFSLPFSTNDMLKPISAHFGYKSFGVFAGIMVCILPRYHKGTLLV